MRSLRVLAAGSAVVAASAVPAVAARPPFPPAPPPTATTSAATTSATASGTALPLAGVRIALDPGHQLGNHNFPAQTGRIVTAGRGLRKPCNTTGTAIPGGLPEATIAWRIVRQTRARLEHLGATVLLTRTSNSEHRWGPCVDVRGRFGGRVGARLMVSVHADGATDRALHGFHVILPSPGHLVDPGNRRPSARLARAVRAGFDGQRIPRSNYVGGGTALSPRNDLGTLDMARVPVAMVEVGNVWNRADAHRMSTPAGRATYARALVAGIRAFLGR